jgi:hypothetical protein
MLLQSINSERSILESKDAILVLSREYEAYSKINEQLRAWIQEKEMLFWEDDTFFPIQMNILLQAIAFL